MTKPQDVMLPNETERRQIFYTLKRWSSYTAWHRILGYFQAWADVHKRSLQIASAQGLEGKTSLPESSYVMLLQDLAYCDEGVSRLRTGDKRVFRCDPMGAIWKASRRMLRHSIQRLGYIDSGDIGINLNATPLWDEFVTATNRLADAWRECAPYIIEPDYMGTPTGYVILFCDDYLRADLARMHFPDPLPDVPNPREDVLIRTGQEVPYSSIWEPVEVPARTLVSLFKPEPPKGPFPITGTMAYLHGGTKAPRKSVYADIKGAPTTWRLLWRDDRYEDGTIPEEEKGYVFQCPEEPKPPTPAPVRTDSDLVIAESGQLAPTAGRWLLEGDLHVSVQLAQDEALPLHEGRKVRWVLAVV